MQSNHEKYDKEAQKQTWISMVQEVTAKLFLQAVNKYYPIFLSLIFPPVKGTETY